MGIIPRFLKSREKAYYPDHPLAFVFHCLQSILPHAARGPLRIQWARQEVLGLEYERRTRVPALRPAA